MTETPLTPTERLVLRPRLSCMVRPIALGLAATVLTVIGLVASAQRVAAQGCPQIVLNGTTTGGAAVKAPTQAGATGRNATSHVIASTGTVHTNSTPCNTPPSFKVTPGTGSFSSGSTFMTVEYCSPNYNIDMSTNVVTLNSVRVDANDARPMPLMSMNPDTMPNSGFCGVTPRSGKTAQEIGALRWQPGLNTMVASVCDDIGNCATHTYTFTYTPYWAVTITPKDSILRVFSAHQDTAYFTVHRVDTDTRIGTYNLTRSCAGVAVSPCTATSAITLIGGETKIVPVSFTGGASISSGRITLIATLSTNALMADTASDSVVASVPGVTLTPKNVALNAAVNAHNTAFFTATNTGPVSALYNFTGVCGAADTACISVPASLTIAAGATVNATVGYKSEASGTTGLVKLRAIHNSIPTAKDSGYYNTTSMTPSAMVATDASSGSTIERSLCLTVAAGHGAASECGDLRLAHALPSIRTKNKSRAPTLLYNSAFAHPKPLVPFVVTLPTNMPVPDSVTATLTINSTVRATGKWIGTDWGYASARRIVLGFDALNDSTGLYNWTAQASSWYGSTRYNTTAVTGELAIVNRANSNFGAGWWLAGLEKLYGLADGSKLWIGGDGSVRHFKLLTGYTNIWIPPFLDGTEGLSYDGTYYTHTMPHGLRVLFDATGRHVKTINRLKDTTFFSYTGQRLDVVQVPPTALNEKYLFSYDAGAPNRILSVAAPALPSQTRITTITTSAGRITAIKEPDTNTVRYGYAPSGETNRIKSRTDRRGTVAFFGYDSAQKVAFDSAASTATHFRAGEAAGWMPNSVDTALAYGIIDGPRRDVGDTTFVWLDKYGEPRHIRNALGQETRLERTNTTFPAVVTRMQAPNGRVISAAYDNHGNIATSIDSGSCVAAICATTTYLWDPAWDFLKKVTAPMGEVTLSSYDPTYGNKVWQQPDADSTNTARRVRFGYDATWHLVNTVQEPVVTNPQRVYYNPMGNVDSVFTPMGVPTRFYLDAIGRDTLVRSTIMAPDTVGVFTKSWYDIADEDTLSRTYSAPGRSDTITVRQSYDPEGNLLIHSTRAAPDTNHLGWLIHSYTYDSLGRKLSEQPQGPSFGTNSYRYDAAGNDTSTNLRSTTFTMQYDALNRLVKRVIPSVTTLGIDGFTFGAAVPADTQTYVFDVAGNMVQANNYFARVTRTYNLNGTLATDLLRVRAADSAAIVFPDAYLLTYGYDREGRRISLKHPSNLASAGTDSVLYSYDATTGLLASVRDPFHNRFSYAYDNALRLRTDTALAGTAAAMIETRGYDDDDRQTSRAQTQVVGGTLTTVYSDGLTYDPRNKITHATFSVPGLEATNADTRYAALGPVVSNNMLAIWNDSLVTDPFGNAQVSYHLAGGSNPTTNIYDHTGSAELDTAVTLRTGTSSPDTVTYLYDLAGSLWKATTLTSAHGGGATPQAIGMQPGRMHVMTTCTIQPCDSWVFARRRVNNRYTADLRLLVSETQFDSVGLNAPAIPVYWEREEYRYDALGRRVWRWLYRGNSKCPVMNKVSGCTTILQETVWDGSQVLWDVRNITTQLTSLGSEMLGNALYTHGAGIDHPLSIGRNSVVIVPKYDWRGKAVSGYCSGTTLCSDLVWPGQQQSAWAYVPPPTDINGYAKAWGGDLIDAGTDGSGYVYMRNRYYDPTSGRFTQVDPIGLAGGLNAYGFAAGDPVNYADPFGLTCKVEGNCTQSDVPGPRPDLGAKGNAIRRGGCGTNDFCKNLFDRYATGRGNLRLSTERFKDIANAAREGKKVGKPVSESRNGQAVSAQQVSFYNTSYATSLGTATMYYSSQGDAVGVHDTYDFDSQKLGSRPLIREIETRVAASVNPGQAKSFSIDYP